MSNEKEKNGKKTDGEGEGKSESKFFSHSFWMLILSLFFYFVLVMSLPFIIVVPITFYMGFGKSYIQEALKKRHSSMESIAVNFSQCLRLFIMQIVWPLSVKIISNDE